MQVDDFIKRLAKETTGHHRILPPLDDKEFEMWRSKFSKSALPEDFLDLLKRTNGIQFWVSAGSPNGYEQILPLREIDYARQLMWGGLANDMDKDAVPYPHWLAISVDQDHSASIVLDTDSFQYYLMDACGADLTSPAGKNVSELLDFAWKFCVKEWETDHQ